MAASSDSDNKKSRKEELGGSKDDRSDTGAGSTELALVSSSAPAGNGTGGVPPAASPAAGAGTAAASAPAAAAAASAAAGKERDYIWTEDAVHVLLDHFLEKYMSYEKGMIRNADWVEIAQRVNQQLEGNKPVKTPEQCKNKVDNLKKQYRKERRRGSLGPTSTNWAFFSRMHDIFESDYKKTGGAAEPPPGGGGGGGGSAAAAAAAAVAATAEEVHPSSNNAGNNNTSNEEAVHRMRSAGGMQPDHHYLASREFLRKQHEEMMQYKRPPSRRSETPPPPPVAPNPISAAHYHQIHQLMLMPETHVHHSSNHHRDSSSAPRKKAKSDKHHHQQQQPQLHHEPPHGMPQRHHHHHQAEGSGGAPSSDSGGGGAAAAVAEGSSKYHRKLHRHQLAELKQNFMEGFTGFAEVMLKIEVAKMEMQRDLERQRAEMELHRTQMMLSNQLQLARYLKSSPLAGPVPPGMPHGEFVPNFGFTESTSGGNTGRLQLAIPIFPDFTALDAVGPYEVLHLLPNVEVLFVSHQPGLYAAGMGMLTLQATASFDQVTRPQVLVVPGGIGTRRLLQDRVILDWIRKVHEHTLYTTSVCTGSLLLGAAGLLKGIEATTHWNSHEMLSEFGAKPVSARIVRQGKIITAAGVSAGIDMALQLAALLSDEATAKSLQLYIEYDPQPPFDSGSVSKAGPEIVSRAKELSSKRIAHLQAGGRAPA